jgi:hypothetical protein
VGSTQWGITLIRNKNYCVVPVSTKIKPHESS